MLSHNKMVFILPLLTYHLRLFLQFRQFIEHHVVHDLNVGSLHSGGTGFDHSGTLKFSKCIDDHGSCDSYTVCDLTCNKNSLFAIHLLKNVGDGFQF